MRKVLHLMKFLEDQDVEWLVRTGSKLFLTPGTTLVTEGEPIDWLYIVLDGRLSVRVGGPNGQILKILEAGEVIGEISFVDSRPPTATVTVVEPACVLSIRHDQLREKLARDVMFAVHFYQGIGAFLADRLRMTVGRLGYGDRHQDNDPDLLDEAFLDGVSIAATRFDKLLKRQLVAQ
jgi:CRP/FNR family transcriptional regulator, cyclic AMP receptor protein